MDVDFGKAARDYGKYRAGMPDALFERLAGFGVGVEGQRALDLGTGTGTVARGLALRGCTVTAVDRSPAIIDEARTLDSKAGVTVEYVVARAEDTGLPDHAFDVVTAGQCWHWFDRPKAAREVRRLIVSGGRFVIAYFDWILLPGNIVDATEELITAHNPRWKRGDGPGLYPDWLRDVAVAGFRDIETFSLDVPATYSHEAWRGRVRASSGVGASLSEAEINRFDAEHERLLKEHFPKEPLEVPHRVFAVVCTAP